MSASSIAKPIFAAVAILVVIVVCALGTLGGLSAASPPTNRTEQTVIATASQDDAKSPAEFAVGEPVRPEQSAAYFVSLLSSTEVQGELKLSTDQKRQIDKGKSVSYRFGSKTYRPKNRLWKILTVEQRTRLSHLERQFVDSTRLCSLLRLHEDVSEDLDLSKEQIERIRKIESDTLRRINDLYRKHRTDDDKLGLLEAMVESEKRSLKVYRDTRGDVVNVLTPTQMERWATMLGEPFNEANLTILNWKPLDGRGRSRN